MNGFIEAAIAYRGGELVAELNEELRSLITAVDDTRKKGSITLTFKIDPPVGKGETMTFTAEIKSTIPKQPRRSQSYYMTEDGMPSLNHPDMDPLFNNNPANTPNVTIEIERTTDHV